MDQRNLILAIALSLFILLTFQFFIFETPPPPDEQAQPGEAQQEQVQRSEVSPPSAGTLGAPTPPGAPATTEPSTTQSRAELLSAQPRVHINTPTLEGSISLVGARIDDLVLKRYRETIDPNSERIVLLSPSSAEHPYFADFGWTGTTGADVRLPTNEALWQADGEVLVPGRPLTLTWDNGEGLRFERVFEIDDGYMFTVTQRIVNESQSAVTLAPYAVTRIEIAA